jgi:short-subunit dehydrogenase
MERIQGGDMQPNILITGATSGIGQALAFELAARGYGLALTARRVEKLAEIRKQIKDRHAGVRVETRTLDVTQYERIPEVIADAGEALGGLDIVFANAGISRGEKIGTGQFEKSRRTVETNLLGAMATVDAAVAYFRKRGRGHVVATSSVTAFRGLPRLGSYSASKAALTTYLEALRAEVYRESIDVTVIYPGYVDTPLNQMQPHRPFVIPAERAAGLIADLIERKAKGGMVPKWPWCVVGPLLRWLPTSLIAK